MPELIHQAAKGAFNQFLSDRNATANQIEFINLVVDYLTEHGAMGPERLYESPFTDINPLGPEGVFSERRIDTLVAILAEVRQRAAA